MNLSGSGSPLLWGVFAAVVLVALAIDLGAFRKQDEAIGTVKALAWTGVWVTIAAIFGGFVWLELGSSKAALFATGYVIEYALSVDNLFVFIVVFRFFSVAPRNQRRVLYWGILSAALLRGMLIFAGSALISRFHWVLYLFGAFLLYTSVQLMLSKDDDEDVDPGKNPVLRILRRLLPVTEEFHGPKFFLVRHGKWMATPLFAVLLVLETTDVFFALDSVPAIFGVTTDPFVVFTSNIFAILGLRSLFFALASMMGKFRYLNIGIAVVLLFVAIKMLAVDFFEVPTGWSLLVIAGILLVSVVASMLAPETPADPKA